MRDSRRGAGCSVSIMACMRLAFGLCLFSLLLAGLGGGASAQTSSGERPLVSGPALQTVCCWRSGDCQQVHFRSRATATGNSLAASQPLTHHWPVTLCCTHMFVMQAVVEPSSRLSMSSKTTWVMISCALAGICTRVRAVRAGTFQSAVARCVVGPSRQHSLIWRVMAAQEVACQTASRLE